MCFKGVMDEEDFSRIDNGVLTSSRYDNDFVELLEKKPSKIALSMLPSYKQKAYARTRALQEEATKSVRAADAKVTAAKWEHFHKGLEADQRKLDNVVGAHAAIADVEHARRQP